MVDVVVVVVWPGLDVSEVVDHGRLNMSKSRKVRARWSAEEAKHGSINQAMHAASPPRLCRQKVYKRMLYYMFQSVCRTAINQSTKSSLSHPLAHNPPNNTEK